MFFLALREEVGTVCGAGIAFDLAAVAFLSTFAKGGHVLVGGAFFPEAELGLAGYGQ